MASITNYVKEHYFDEVSRAGTDYFLQNVIRLGVIADELKELVSVEFCEIKYVSAVKMTFFICRWKEGAGGYE